MKLRTSVASVLLVASVTLGSTVAWAQPAAPTGADRNAAREFAIQGIAANNRQDWPVVLDRFTQAEQRFHAPIHLQYIAIALEHATPPRLAEAAEVWRRLSNETLAPDAPAPFRAAVDLARRELPRVEGLMRASQATATPVTTPVATPVVTPVTAPPVDHSASQAVSVQTPPPEGSVTTRTVSSPLRTVGFVVGGVGVAALIGGAITGVMASGAFSDLEAACPARQCSNASDLAKRDDVDTLSGMTNALLIGGGVLAATGVVMVILGRPRTETVQVGFNGRDLLIGGRF
ncbi:MAG: uncharacterized protein JWM10_4688 [Myxococcaceae bacterium]|nr:uncharacterized protein [Myxococcaceae bacterium]